MGKYKDSIRKYWYHFILGPLFMVLEACGEFILPYINAEIINVGASNGDSSYIIRKGLIMLVIALIMMICGILGANFAVRGSSLLSADIRLKTFRKIQNFSFSDIDSFTTGSLITRITNDVTQIQNFAHSLLRGMFRSPVMIIGALVMSFLLNRTLAYVILVIVILVSLSIALIIVLASPRYSKMQESLDDLNAKIGETISNERVIKSFVREAYAVDKFSKANDALMLKSTSALKMMLLLQPISSLAINITTLLVVWISGKQIMLGTMELGTLTAFITYLSQVLMALNFLATIVLQGTRATTSDKRISAVLNWETTLNDIHSSHPDSEVIQGAISFEDVSFQYTADNSEDILKHINLTIKAGEFVGIIGSTGSGKSSLVSLIPRLYDVKEGSVKVDGIDVKDYSLKNLRSSVAMVLQKNTLFSGTIYENLCWGKEDATEQEIMNALSAAAADEFVNSFSKGIHSDIEQGGVNLSGGQRQRLCIARALLRSPKILILDDSTSAVDTATDLKIRKSLRILFPDITKLIIAQRITSVIDADRIIVLDEGEVVGCGKHETLYETCKAYREIYESQKEA